MIKEFKDYDYSYKNIDPYGEETWGDVFTIEDYWELIRNDDEFYYKYFTRHSISFALEVNGKDFDFFIDLDENDIIKLYDDSNPPQYMPLYYCTKKELMDKIEYLSEKKLNEQINQDIDPYGEENWDEYTLEDYWELVQKFNFFTYKKYNDGDHISFGIDYPHRGNLDFVIQIEYGITKLYYLLNAYDTRRMILYDCTEKELWDKITYLVEGV